MYRSKTRWIQSQIDEHRVEELVREAGIHPMIARILVLRGLNSQEQVARFPVCPPMTCTIPTTCTGWGKR